MIWAFRSQNIDERKILQNRIFTRPTIITNLQEEIIAVNNKWELMCLFDAEEAFGRKPSLLQGELTDIDVATTFGNGVRNDYLTFATLINYKKDKTPFINCIFGYQVGDILIAETYAEKSL